MVKRMVWINGRGDEVASATPQQLLAYGLRRHRTATINGMQCLLTAVDPSPADRIVERLGASGFQA